LRPQTSNCHGQDSDTGRQRPSCFLTCSKEFGACA
jgi:hypothetical protein